MRVGDAVPAGGQIAAAHGLEQFGAGGHQRVVGRGRGLAATFHFARAPAVAPSACVLRLRLHSAWVRGRGSAYATELRLSCGCVASALRTLQLRLNEFDGPIPDELRLCTALTKLHLDGNRLSGEAHFSQS